MVGVRAMFVVARTLHAARIFKFPLLNEHNVQKKSQNLYILSRCAKVSSAIFA